MKKPTVTILFLVAMLLIACSQVTVVEVRVFAASSRNRLKGAKVTVLLKNPVTGQKHIVERVKPDKNHFSLNNYRLGSGEQKKSYIEVTVSLAGFKTFTGAYTNLDYLDRNNRSPYQRFLDVYLQKMEK